MRKTKILLLAGTVLPTFALGWPAYAEAPRPEAPIVLAQQDGEPGSRREQRQQERAQQREERQQDRAQQREERGGGADRAQQREERQQERAQQREDRGGGADRAQQREERQKDRAEQREDRGGADRAKQREERTQQREERQKDRAEQREDRQDRGGGDRAQQREERTQQREDRQKDRAEQREDRQDRQDRGGGDKAQQREERTQQREERQKDRAEQREDRQDRGGANGDRGSLRDRMEKDRQDRAGGDRMDKREDAKDRRDDRQDKREDAKDRRDDRQDKREDARDRRDDRREDARIDRLKDERRERRDGDRVFITEPGGRTIIREGGKTIIRRDETARFRIGARDIREERRGGEIRTVVTRPDGSRIITITDEDGRLLRRIREDGGREYVLIDNRPRGGRGFFVDLDIAPPRISIPRERYIVDADTASADDIYDAFDSEPVARPERSYSLDEIRQSAPLRSYVRSVDLDSINFDFGSWEVRDDQIKKLETVGNGMERAIKKNPQTVFMIEGHTDAVGAADDNLSLSDRRAESVAEILTKYFDVPAENITTQGYGEQYLKVDTQEPEERNRRVSVRNITPLLSSKN